MPGQATPDPLAPPRTSAPARRPGRLGAYSA